MKRLITLVLLLAVTGMTLTTHAQDCGERKASFTCLLDFSPKVSLNHLWHFSSLDLNISPGVAFENGLSLRIPVEAVTGLSKSGYKANSGNFAENGTIGLNIGYNVMDKGPYRIELNASGGSTYLKTPYSFAYADLGARFGFHGDLYFGIGFRYMSPYKCADITQQVCMYISIGHFWF